MAAEEVQNAVENNTTNGAAKEEKPVVYTAFKAKIVVEAPKASEAVAFYKAAFGAEEVKRDMQLKRKADQEQPLVESADLKLGSVVFSVSDSSLDSSLVKSGGVYCLETEEIEAAINKAVTAGAVAEGEISEIEGVGRVAKLKDPFGNLWVLSTPATPAPVPTPLTTV